MADPLTPPPLLNAIAEPPAGLTPRVWARWFALLQQQVMAGGGGTEGPPGRRGNRGSPGQPDRRGQRDPRATQGLRVPRAVQEPPGARGQHGPTGDPGPTGATGSQGPQGIQGIQGPQGDPGTPGPTTEEIQDVMATTIIDSLHLNWTYNDTLNQLSANIYGSSVGTADLTNNGVTYAKIQNVTDNRVLGRSAGSAGDVQELTTGAGLTLAGGVLSATTLYEEGTFTATATGFGGTAPSGTARYVRIGAQVTLGLPALSGTSNSAGFTITGLPAPLLPVALQVFWASMTDNGVNLAGLVIVDSTGVITLAQTNYSGFVASGAKGLNGVLTFTYLLT